MRNRSSWSLVVVTSALAGCVGLPDVEQGAGSVEQESVDAAVGAIEIRGVLRCSAVAIDEWHIATAAYCLPAAHIDNPELLGRSEMFFVTGAAIDAPGARRIPVIAHEVLGQGVPEPLQADLGIGRLAEPVQGPFLPLAPVGAAWPEWTTSMRVVSMGAPTDTAPFGARRSVELQVGATNAELIDLYHPDTAFCMVDMGGAVIATVDDRPVLAGVLGHWATRGGEPASNGDWCSAASGQAFATRTEQGAFLATAGAAIDDRMGFALELFEPGPGGQWLLFESAVLERGTAHGVGLTMPVGATSLTMDLVAFPGDPAPQLAVGRGRMPGVGQPPACESIGQACMQGDQDACAQYDRDCVEPVFVDADLLPTASHRLVSTIELDGTGQYIGINLGNLSGDRPTRYALAVWTTTPPAAAQAP